MAAREFASSSFFPQPGKIRLQVLLIWLLLKTPPSLLPDGNDKLIDHETNQGGQIHLQPEEAPLGTARFVKFFNSRFYEEFLRKPAADPQLQVLRARLIEELRISIRRRITLVRKTSSRRRETFACSPRCWVAGFGRWRSATSGIVRSVQSGHSENNVYLHPPGY